MENLIGTDYVLQIDTVTPTSTYTRGDSDEYRTIACLTTNGLEIAVATQDTTNKCSEGTTQSVPGLLSWSFSGDGQATSITLLEEDTKANFQEILNLIVAKTVFFARWTNISNSLVREGMGYLSAYNETAGNAEPYTFTFTFTGSGQIFTEPATT
jgi:hypothetical protein